MSAVREMLFLVLIALTPTFLFPLAYDQAGKRFRRKSDLESKAGNHIVLTLTCALSMIFSSLFSTYLHGYIPLSYGLVPLFTAMLYERLRTSIILAVLQLLLYFCFSDTQSIFGFLLDTGLLVFPLVLMSGDRFKQSDRKGKAGILSLYLLVGALLATTAPFFLHIEDLQDNFKFILFAYINIAVMLLCGLILIQAIEETLGKEMMKAHADKLAGQLYREEERMQQVMDAVPLSVILLDQKGSINMLNDTFLKLYRSKFPDDGREELLGKHFFTLFKTAKIGIADMSSHMHDVFSGKQSFNELVQHEDKMFFTSISPIIKEHSGRVSGAVVIAQDITELETLRMELNNVDRLSLVGQMAAGITHEIRNPMSVVRGFLQLMREKSPVSLDNYYRIVLDELDRANGIINDFLSLAQNRPVHKENTSLEEIIQELAPLIWADANLRGQSVEVRQAEQLPKLELNPKEIKQLILNLCRNAMEAMESNGQLTLETRLVPEGVELLVMDTGPGIPDEVQKALFEPFFTTKAKGTGMGLSLCKSIVDRHNGTVRVDSEIGVGTTFSVIFPVAG